MVSYRLVGTSQAVGPVAAGRDDAGIFATLYPALVRFAGAVRPIGMDAEDLVQEALARTLATRPLHSIDDPQAYLRTAMIRIAANQVRGLRRLRARSARADRVASISDAYPSDLDDLLRVGSRARAVLYLTIVERESYRTAAALLGCSEPAARALASRALRALHLELDGEVAGKEQP